MTTHTRMEPSPAFTAKDGPLRWAETRALIRKDFERFFPPTDERPALSKRVFWLLLPSYQCMLLYRLYRHAYLRGWRKLASFLFLVSLYLTRAEIPPSTSIGGGCLICHCPVILCGRIGENFTLMGDGGIGGGFESDDIGGGPGLPVVGNDVVMAIKSIVLGPVRIGDGARLGPSCTVMRDVPAGAVVAGPLSRITCGTETTHNVRATS